MSIFSEEYEATLRVTNKSDNNSDNNSDHQRIIETATDLLFHGGCPDGIGSVFPFYLRRKNDYRLNKIYMHGVNHHEKTNMNRYKGRIVVLLDFCYIPEELIRLCNFAKEVWVLDHHDTTLRTREIVDYVYSLHPADSDDHPDEYDPELVRRCNTLAIRKNNLNWVIDMKRSAAQISWDFVYPNKPRPWFIEIIADRDLWKWEVPDSKEIGKALYYYDYYRWEMMEEFYHMSAEESLATQSILTEKGRILLEQEDRDISYCASRAVVCEFMGHRIKLTNCPPNLRSEVGNYIAGDDCDIAVMWRYDFLQDQFWISMRVPDESDINLAILAELFSGGGHPPAAGFTIHGPKSTIWRDATTLQRMKLAHGSLHDYFVTLSM